MIRIFALFTFLLASAAPAFAAGSFLQNWQAFEKSCPAAARAGLYKLSVQGGHGAKETLTVRFDKSSGAAEFLKVEHGTKGLVMKLDGEALKHHRAWLLVDVLDKFPGMELVALRQSEHSPAFTPNMNGGKWTLDLDIYALDGNTYRNVFASSRMLELLGSFPTCLESRGLSLEGELVVDGFVNSLRGM